MRSGKLKYHGSISVLSRNRIIRKRYILWLLYTRSIFIGYQHSAFRYQVERYFLAECR